MTEPEKIEKGAAGLFMSGTEHYTIPEDGYSRFSYPKVIKMMKFDVTRHRISGFGSMMTMRTDTIFGMQLLTMSFMPFEGNSVPYLLIDIMKMRKKRLIFVEYYDCTASAAKQELLEKVCAKYADIPDHTEKPAWYIGERTDYSLIKSLAPDSSVSLSAIAADSIRAYKKSAFSADRSEANIPGLLTFRDRMINEGNPSSDILKKVFGEEGAADFFRECVMPDR